MRGWRWQKIMWNQKDSNIDRNVIRGRGGGGGCGTARSIAVAVDRDKGSQHALKWALGNVVSKDETVKLIYVKVKKDDASMEEYDANPMEIFLSFRCFCRRREVECETITLEDQDVAKALVDYVCQNGISTLFLGSSSKTGISRLFKASDIPTNVLKWAPDFCTVYVIAKGKVTSVKNATRCAPIISSTTTTAAATARIPPLPNSSSHHNRTPETNERSYDEMSAVDIDNPIGSSGRLSVDSNFFQFYENLGSDLNKEVSPRSSNLNKEVSPRSSNFNSNRFESSISSVSGSGLQRDQTPLTDSNIIPNGLENVRMSLSPSMNNNNNMEDYEDEMRRMRIELKQTIDMYHAACKEALAAKQEALAAKQKLAELEEGKVKEEKRSKEANLSEENELEMEEKSKSKWKNAIGATEVQKLVEIEVQKRMDAEMRSLRETELKRKVLKALGQSHILYKYQSLLHMVVVLFLFYVYFSLFMS